MQYNKHGLEVGIIEKWQDDKGYGFIKTADNKSIFFHISDYRPPKRPVIGEEVVFELGMGKNNQPKAKQVQEKSFVAQKQQRQQQKLARQRNYQTQQAAFKSGQTRNLIIAVVFYAVLAILAWQKLIPWMLVGWYVLLGLLTFGFYAKDKHAAQNDHWRTPEKTLHLLALLGGWVGAMLAQTYLRHKSSKTQFRVLYYVTVFLNSIALLFMIFGGDLEGLANLTKKLGLL